ncbi:hypothetical protein D3C73_1239590 [compost metagenome]
MRGAKRYGVRHRARGKAGPRADLARVYAFVAQEIAGAGREIAGGVARGDVHAQKFVVAFARAKCAVDHRAFGDVVFGT